MPELTVAPVSHKAAEYAVLNWHYSQKMPAGRLVRFGVWEAGRFTGAVLYGRGSNNRIGSPYGLAQYEVCELVRVALREHAAPVSQIVAATLGELRRTNPRMRLVVSYADPAQGHRGGIYQAGNWTYAGRSQAQADLIVDGKPMHKRTASSRYGTTSPERIRALTGKSAAWAPASWKHTYLMPLDRGMARRVRKLSRPYPAAAE